MTKRALFVLVPSFAPTTGPVKGAIALCNSLTADFNVFLVGLKPSGPILDHLESDMKVVELGKVKGWRARLQAYRDMLEDTGGRECAVSLSLCLSADCFNFMSRKHAYTIASIRGHLPRTYRVDYGWIGTLVARAHYLLASRLDSVVTMTEGMARQFETVTGKRPRVIGNFVDEDGLEPYRSQGSPENHPCRFVFVGRLVPLKLPDLVIKAVCRLADEGLPCELDLYGDGPLMVRLKAMAEECGRGDIIRFHGHIGNPWAEAAKAHCLVLPSLTEGVSRAALEALYLGIPCVMRDVDSNADLIRPGVNGELFGKDVELASAMEKSARLGRELAKDRPILLEKAFRQSYAVDGFRKLIQDMG